MPKASARAEAFSMVFEKMCEIGEEKMTIDDNATELIRETEICELVHALMEYAHKLENMVIKLRTETNELSLKLNTSAPYPNLHSDIYESFDDYPAFTRYKELSQYSFVADAKEIAETLQLLFDDSSNYLNLETGEIVCIEDRYLGMAEDGETPADIQSPTDKENLIAAIDIIENNKKYIALPGKNDINEYDMMDEFAFNYPNKRISCLLQKAITGKGAFRRFKDNIAELGIEDKWYSFRDARYMNIAENWLKDNSIPYKKQ